VAVSLTLGLVLAVGFSVWRSWGLSYDQQMQSLFYQNKANQAKKIEKGQHCLDMRSNEDIYGKNITAFSMASLRCCSSRCRWLFR